MSNCFKWIEFASTFCTTDSGDIEGMVENKDLNSALDTYFQEIDDSQGNNNGADTTKLEEVFKIVAGEDSLISWTELKEIMDKTLQRDMELESLSQSTCRSMVALVDRDRMGKLGVKEFISLWDYVNNLKTVFLSNDVNNQGYLDEDETRNALSQAGLDVSDKVLNSLTTRHGDQERKFTFEDFLVCATRIKNMTDLFKDMDREQNASITISLAEFVEKTLYC